MLLLCEYLRSPCTQFFVEGIVLYPISMHMMLCAFNNYGNDISLPIFPSYPLPQPFCINQSDNIEKTSQVQMMKVIYSRAANVLIRLGTEQESDRAGIDLIERVYDSLGTPDLPIIKASRPEKLLDLALPCWSSAEWAPVAQILKRSWFTRIWIV